MELSPTFVRRALEEPRKELDQNTLELPKQKGSSRSARNDQLWFGRLKEACL